MWLPFLTVSLLKVFHPHIRKEILQHISYGEFIFLNSVLIGTISFIYTYIWQDADIYKLTNLSLQQYISAFFLAAVTIISSIIVFKIQENGIVSSSFILKMVSSFMMLIVGIFLYNETITPKQLCGIFLGILAILLIKG
jgi:drug/metabolite transporter (DMT)-like permease